MSDQEIRFAFFLLILSIGIGCVFVMYLKDSNIASKIAFCLYITTSSLTVILLILLMRQEEIKSQINIFQEELVKNGHATWHVEKGKPTIIINKKQ